MRERFAATTTDLLDQHAALAVVLADISAALFTEAARRHPDRVINVGIREQLLLNVGAGMALAGMRPIVHTFASFLIERAFEQIKLGFNHQDVGGVLVSAGASYDVSTGGRTHQAPGDVALLDTLPDWTIHVPGHPDELDTLLRTAAADTGRVYLRTSTSHNTRPQPVDGSGRMLVLRRGAGATVIAVGPMLDPVLAAVEGTDLTVLYAATVRPFDADTLTQTLASPAVVLVEPYLAGTSARCVTDALSHIPHRLLSLGVPRAELRRYGTPEQHQAAHGLDAAGIRRRLTDLGIL
jgi:transketolase